MRRVLIIGAAGFIGSHLAARCLARGDTVHVVVREGSDTSRLAPLCGIVRHAIARDDPSGGAAVLPAAAPDEVYYLAAATRRQGAADAASATVFEEIAPLVRLLEGLAALPRPPYALIRAGSLAEYGAAPAPFHEGQREAPLTPYAAALVAGTHYGAMMQRALPFQIVTARLTLTYGPTQSTSFLVPHLIERLTAGLPVRISHPSHARDLLHVDDVVAGLLALARPTQSLRGSVVNLSSGTRLTVPTITEAVRAAVGAPRELVSISPIVTDAGGTIADLWAVPDRAREVAGWAPRLDLAAGLARTVAALSARKAA